MEPMFFLTISVAIVSSQPVILLRVMCRMGWQMRWLKVLMSDDRLGSNYADICVSVVLRLSLI